MVETVLAWSGPLFVVTFLTFWIGLGHNLPPPNFMGMTGQELVDTYYAKYQADIKLAMAVCAAVGFLYMAWSCLLASMMHDADGGATVFSFMELSGGVLTAWVLGFCPAVWLVCATYATRINPDLILTIHSFTWFVFDMTYMITTLQVLGLGLFTVLNKKQTMFPEWAGWSAIAVGIIFIPLTLIPYFSTGPFRVSGLWNFYVVFTTWGFAFFCPYSYFIIRELRRRRRAILFSETAVLRSLST